MSAIEYSLKLTQLSKYDPNMVENSRELFSKYSESVRICRQWKLFNNAYPKYKYLTLMVHAEQIEEKNIKKKNR